MTQQDPQSAAATKQDIAMLMEMMGNMVTKEDLHNMATKEDLQQQKEELMQHFGLVAENMREDLIGANSDKLADHERRIVQLEQVVH